MAGAKIESLCGSACPEFYADQEIYLGSQMEQERMIVAEGSVFKVYLDWPFGDAMNSVKVGNDTF